MDIYRQEEVAKLHLAHYKQKRISKERCFYQKVEYLTRVGDLLSANTGDDENNGGYQANYEKALLRREAAKNALPALGLQKKATKVGRESRNI